MALIQPHEVKFWSAGFLPPKNHEYTSISPKVSIDGVTVRYGYDDSAITPAILRGYALLRNDATNIANKRFATDITLKNVEVKKSGVVGNKLQSLLQLTYREASLATATANNFLKDVDFLFERIKNNHIPDAVSVPYDQAFAPISLYDIGDIGVTQDITVDSSDYVGATITTPYNIHLNFRNQVCSNLFREGLGGATGVGSSTVKLTNCKILQVSTGPATLAIPTTVDNCEFDYFSYYTGSDPAAPSTLGFNGYIQIVNYNGCSVLLPRYPGNESVRSELKTRSLANYKDPVIYES